MVNKQALKMPVLNRLGGDSTTDIVGVMCRRKGLVTVDFCSRCPEFIPACKVKQDDPLEGKDGIDPHTGNSYATCKWFGEILRKQPLFGARRIGQGILEFGRRHF